MRLGLSCRHKTSVGCMTIEVKKLIILNLTTKMLETEPQASSKEESQLPSSLTIFKFAAARGKEIEIMRKALSSRSGTKLAFQKLPKHMRRRAMSHNVKRLPRRLREIHLSQMKKSGLPPKQKRPSRKYRRRPYNLMSDYMRRQRRIKWLNTHIWHAKRFHMVEKWGYKLPDRPCDRAFKACYRATVSHCLIQDVSYYNCVEIKGDYEIIVNNFKNITDSRTGLTVGAKCFSKGNREGCTTIFKNNENKRAIGTIYFNWKPIQITNNYVLWIWIHAAYYSEILDTITNCFNLKLCEMEVDSSPLLYESDDGNIKLKELQFELNRFRLTGPLSTSVLYNCFHVSENNENTVDWVKNYGGSTHLQSQKEYWKNLNSIISPGELPPHMILSLIICDPRLYLPKKRTKVVPDVETKSTFCGDTLPECAESPLWDSTVRNLVKDSKISNIHLADMQKKLLVPGSASEEKAVPIPILLIQRPGKKEQQNVGYGSGWDIILPSDWAQAIWVSLIMWGAKPGGLRESEAIAFYMDHDILYPDTDAGIEEEFFESNKCKELFFKLPPNKRTNYNKFQITSPFQCNWKLLLSEWTKNDDQIRDFFVLRDKKVLRNIQELLVSKSKSELPKCPNNCLIPIAIKLSDKGLCKKFAIICLLEEGDQNYCPTEPNCLDKNETLRKKMRKNHQTLLKRLRRQRIRGKRNGKVIPLDMDVLKNYTTAMRKLWLPDAMTIRHSCAREVIGFVKHGDFSFVIGQSKAVGYIAFSALPSLLSMKCTNKVLIRNTNSKQYRLGTIEVICN